MDSVAQMDLVNDALNQNDLGSYGSMLELICDNWKDLSANGVSENLRKALIVSFLERIEPE